MVTNEYPYIIAELGCNHNGDMDLAKRMIEEAQKCGCNAIKLQLWKKEDLFTEAYLRDLENGKINLENVSQWKTESLGLNNIFEQIDKFSFQEKEHVEIFEYSKKIGIDYSSTAVTKEGIDFLIEQNVAFVKVASMDMNNMEILEHLVSKDYPAVISTGMSTLSEIQQFVNIIPEKCKKNITLLHCVSIYPPNNKILNLRFIRTLKSLFKNIRIGFSDHTLGYSISLAAVALGAQVIEKHFTLDINMPGWDHRVSAQPDEMKIICKESKRITDALGSKEKVLSEAEFQKRSKFRRSIVSARNILKGEIIKREDLAIKRPGNGIAPNEIKEVLGKTAKRNIKENKLISWEDLV